MSSSAQTMLAGVEPRRRRRPGEVERELRAQIEADERRLREIARELERGARGTRCPRCGCTALGPRCTVPIGDDEAGVCVPRGTLGLRRCSACL